MSGINQVILSGRLGQDPEIRTFQNGGRVANLSVATSESYKDRDTGERREITEWHRVAVTADGLVGICEKYLHKGDRVGIVGKLRTRKWQDQEGRDRYATEILVAPYHGQIDLQGEARPRLEPGTGGGSAGAPGGGYGGAEIDDEIPF